MSKTLRIAAQSVSASELEQIKALMHGMQMPTRWEWSSDAARADVLLIDVDSLYGHMDWLKAQSQGRKIICLTASSMGEQDVVIARPISVGGIKHALALAAGDDLGTAGVKPAASNTPIATIPARARVTAEQPAVAQVVPAARRVITGEQQRITGEHPAVATAAAVMPRRVTGEQPAVAMPRPNPAPAASAPPVRVTGQQRAVPAAPLAAPEPVPALKPVAVTLADFLLGDELDQPMMIARNGLPALVVDPQGDRYYGGLTLKPLLPYCQGRIDRAEWKPVPEKDLNALRSSGSGLPLSRLLWLYTLGTSNGVALLPGLDPNSRFKLLKWPQIEREFPKHFRIATAMMKAPSLLVEVSDFAGAALGEVIDFVNAYAAIGVVCQENQAPLTDRKLALERLRARAS
jgi:hypothetical protein